VSLISSVTDVDYQGEICEPGKVFRKDCNLCHCSNDGQSSACTKLQCPVKPLPGRGM